MATVINININSDPFPSPGDFGDRHLPMDTILLMEGYTATREFEERAKKKGKGRKGKNCTKGQVCGLSCISKTRTCLQNMNSAEKAAHTKAKQAVKGGGGTGGGVQSAAPTRATMRRLESKYEQLTAQVSEAYQLAQHETDEAKQQELFDRYQSLKAQKRDVVSKMKELQQQGVKTSDEIATEKQQKQEFKQVKGVVAKGESIAKKYLKGTDPDSDVQSAMEQLHGRLYSGSKLSRDDAQKLADQVTVNFPEYHGKDFVRNTLTDYYQLTGGKGADSLDRVFVDYDNPRAYANKGDRSINLGLTGTMDNGEVRRILFHELGHHTEFSTPTADTTASAWVKSRATGGIASLNDLVAPGNAKYDRDEVAYPDKFINPYVGKTYERSASTATEVLSMGIEHFSSPAKMAKLYEMDKEHFYLTLGIISD